MTTIAYRAGTLAVDTLGSNGNWVIARHHQKMFRLDDGTIVAGCGTLAHVLGYIDYIRKGADGSPPSNLDDYGVLHLTPDGLFMHEAGHKYQVHDEIYASGSGAPAAMAAMYAGATAEEAIRIAMLLDPHTGGEVVTMGLQTDDRKSNVVHLPPYEG